MGLDDRWLRDYQLSHQSGVTRVSFETQACDLIVVGS